MSLPGLKGQHSKEGFHFESASGGWYYARKDGETIGKVVRVGSRWRAHLPGGITATAENRSRALLKAMKKVK